jgi:DNA polymerase-3 subunit delta
MIIKSYDLNKLDINKNNIILFYGQNQGAKEEEINKIISKNKVVVNKYDEKQVLDNTENMHNELFSSSLFQEEKIIIFNRVTDKLFKLIETLEDKDLGHKGLIINSDNLEKKSKIRTLFEKSKKFICAAFYPDSHDTLSKIAFNFLKKDSIPISQANINLVINKCNGDRGVLKNELNKIKFFVGNGKKLTTENLIKLINLIENFSISELIDNCLAKNKLKTIEILNENNYTSDDCIIIVRTFLQKLKRLQKLSSDFSENKDLNKTIANSRPPIFWKDKEIVKKQINSWQFKEINELIFDLNSVELQIKKNATNSVNIVSNFILDRLDERTNNNPL